MPPSRAEAASLVICHEAVLKQPDIKLASPILRLKGDEREKFQASKVKLQNIAKLNEMSSKINFSAPNENRLYYGIVNLTPRFIVVSMFLPISMRFMAWL